MTYKKSAFFIFLTALALTMSFGSFFIGFFEGPQTAHYINLTSLTLAVILILLLIVNTFKKENEIIQKQLGLFVVLILALSINLLVNVAFINFRYGYSNWQYTNIFKMEFVNRRK